MLSRYRWTWAGLGFGLVLFVFGFAAAGMGHGTVLPSAVFGAPIGIFIPVLPVPFWWMAIGHSLDRRLGRLAVILLTLHTASALGALLVGTPSENGEDQWRYFDRMAAIDPIGIWLGFAIYGVGLYVAWRLAIQRMNAVA